MEFHTYADLFPLIEGDEFDALVTDVRERGLIEPVVMYQDQILDGRNRYRACVTAGVEPKFRDFEGDDALAFVVSSNVRRRHLSESQRAMVGQSLATLRDGERKSGQKEVFTQTEVARMLNVSRTAIQMARRVMTTGHVDLGIAVNSGLIDLGPAIHISKLPQNEQAELISEVRSGSRKPADAGKEAYKRKRIADRKALAAASHVGVSGLSGDGWCVEVGDFREVLNLEPGSVDLIVTDPPYDDVSLPLYGALAEWAVSVLRPGGVCAVYAGCARLPEVFDELRAGGLSYRWTFCLDQQQGSQSRFVSLNIMQRWKPIIICCKDQWKTTPWGPDVLISPGPDKRQHDWQQSISPVVELIERYSEPGWVVADPFLGGGTTGVAAIQGKRQFIGCELDPDQAIIAANRLTNL